MKIKILAIMIAVLLAMLASGCLENGKASEINSQENPQEKTTTNHKMSIIDTSERMALTEKETEENIVSGKNSRFTVDDSDNILSRELTYEKGMKII